MNAIITLLLLFILVGYLISLIVSGKDTSGLKFMLLGLSFILVGGIIAVDDNSDLGGLEYLFVFVGLLFSVVGFGKKN
ncbi:hypothetical protein SAMN05421676_10294 [Salinibacillus kushneri]|uniref:Uncharacterized protein n=1 Tax=Salinibacillus kushneri TaxID=237682 RepID=A0A1I0AB13_9BACI|nr:hypothetical protein [Salinibacillus kushneri]SES91225.1 hypothetical protein SAMN05421676_10294 [Salinibacillus kushneri]